MDIEAELRAILIKAVPTWDGDVATWDRDMIDSLDYIELMFEIEDHFNVNLDTVDLKDLKTPLDLIAHIKKEMKP